MISSDECCLFVSDDDLVVIWLLMLLSFNTKCIHRGEIDVDSTMLNLKLIPLLLLDNPRSHAHGAQKFAHRVVSIPAAHAPCKFPGKIPEFGPIWGRRTVECADGAGERGKAAAASTWSSQRPADWRTTIDYTREGDSFFSPQNLSGSLFMVTMDILCQQSNSQPTTG